ncbi:serine hydrolase domain-containing protein [Dyadobacter sp. OTU695]|uniref:serine hydrolase domain-containing protein n=1 Tax=Dyadobacter sp. OTU695 TaxID=3043860 RepID=UPI00313C21A9
MKNLLIAVLLACCQAVSAQSIDQIIDSKIRSAEARQKAYVDSLFKVKAPEEPKPEEPKLDSCKRGPIPERIFNITQSGATIVFDGDGVFGWNYSIYQGELKKAGGNSGDKDLESNTVPITFSLESGDYTLKLTGKTCKSKVYSKSFTVPRPTGENGNPGQPNGPPVIDKDAKYEFILGTTGGGFDPDARYGIKEGSLESEDKESWLERINAFKYDWGWGITGIALWIHWDGYEPQKGKYQTEALKRTIQFCRERGLSLSIAFLAKRKRNDGFIREEEIVKFSNGELYMEGPRDQPNVGVWAGYGCDRVNKLMEGAIKDIAATLATYEKAGYMSLFGGHTGELVNHVSNFNGIWTAGDFSDDNLSEFNEFVKRRGLANPGRPPMIEGPGIDWPHPDFNNPLGLEFARFQTYNIAKQYTFFVKAVKSVSNLPCIYPYAAASNRQLRSTANAPIRYIAGAGDGAYGSEGDGVSDFVAKFRCNSVNLGNFPNGISAAEVDPSDTSHERETTGRDPSYGKANPDYNAVKQALEQLYAHGLRFGHTAMAFSVREILNWGPTLKDLHVSWIGKPYLRPQIDDSNTVSVEVTQKVRNSQDLMEGINPYEKYTKYTHNDYWGGVSPEVGDGGGPAPQPSKDYSPVKSILEGNAAKYNWSYVFELKSPTGTLYSLQVGQYNKDSRLKVMSHSKFTTGVIISYLIDKGLLSLDTRVGDVIKSWDLPDRAGITIRQIMGHLSGIPDNTDNEGKKSLEFYVDELAKKPGFTKPGEKFIYSTSSYQVVARMAEIVTGKKWKDLFEEILRAPCEMGSAQYNPYQEGPPAQDPDNPLAGYGLICSESEWMNFISMIRDGGVFKGRRVLSENVFNILKTKCSPGWSDWCVGVMFTDGQYISEAASGVGTFILPFKYAGTIFTQSTHADTYWPNRWVRDKVLEIYQQ